MNPLPDSASLQSLSPQQCAALAARAARRVQDCFNPPEDSPLGKEHSAAIEDAITFVESFARGEIGRPFTIPDEALAATGAAKAEEGRYEQLEARLQEAEKLEREVRFCPDTTGPEASRSMELVAMSETIVLSSRCAKNAAFAAVVATAVTFDRPAANTVTCFDYAVAAVSGDKKTEFITRVRCDYDTLMNGGTPPDISNHDLLPLEGLESHVLQTLQDYVTGESSGEVTESEEKGATSQASVIDPSASGPLGPIW